MSNSSRYQCKKILEKITEIHKLISKIERSGKSPLYINDPEFRTLKELRTHIHKLNTKTLLKFKDKDLNDFIGDVYPTYLNLEQFLSNAGSKIHIKNSVNQASGLYKVQGQNISKQNNPGNYEPVFKVKDFNESSKIHVFGEDIMVLNYSHRNILDTIEIYSEIQPGKFEEISKFESKLPAVRKAPSETTFLFSVTNEDMRFIGKTETGYKIIPVSNAVWSSISKKEHSEDKKLNELFDLQEDSKNYLIQKYLHRPKQR